LLPLGLESGENHHLTSTQERSGPPAKCQKNVDVMYDLYFRVRDGR